MKKYIIVIPIILLAVFLISQIFISITCNNVQALSYGINVEGHFTTFADAEVLQREHKIVIEDEDWEDNLEIDLTSAVGFALGSNIEYTPGIQMIIDGALTTTSDSDIVTGPGGREEKMNASLILASLRLTGEIDLAEFAEMYDIPSILMRAGLGYYHGFGELDSTDLEFSEESLDGGNLGFRLGSGIRYDLNENISIKGTIGYRILEIPFQQHTNLSGLELSGGFTYGF